MTDATALFALIFGVPALLFAIVFTAVAVKAPRGGSVLSAMLFASVVPVVFWARTAGYYSGAGLFLLSSLVISACGVAVGVIGILRASKQHREKNGGP
jgi:ABC-type transport system involved in cytochrome c biogenesis permease component